MDNLAPSDKKIKRVLIIDDQPMIRTGIRAMIEYKFNILQLRVSEAEDYSDAIRKISSTRYDLILLDYKLPGFEGPQILQEILKTDPDIKAICVSNYQEIINIQNMIDAGVAGYIGKNVSTAELVTAIQTVLAGKSYYSASVANTLLEKENRKQIIKVREETNLTTREKEVLKLIAAGKSTKSIAQQLYVGERTVETHRKNIMQKVGVKNAAELVAAAYKKKLLP